MTRSKTKYLIGLLFLIFAHVARAGDWSLDVVPNGSTATGQLIGIREPFYVVLTNTTPRALTVWSEECSWGYDNLSFEFTAKDGKLVKVRKENGFFTINFPMPLLVGPGRHFVLSVVLKDKNDTWLNTETLDGPMTLRAVYQNINFRGPKKSSDNAQMDAQINSGWEGEVDSEPMAVTISR